MKANKKLPTEVIQAYRIVENSACNWADLIQVQQNIREFHLWNNSTKIHAKVINACNLLRDYFELEDTEIQL